MKSRILWYSFANVVFRNSKLKNKILHFYFGMFTELVHMDCEARRGEIRKSSWN